MPSRRLIRFGAWSLIVGALSFIGVFIYLASNFNYPAVLAGHAIEVLPRLRAGGDTMRAIWVVYALLPLTLLPGAVASHAAASHHLASMNLALQLATLGTLAMCLGLMRWPSIHWALAEAWPHADASTRQSLAAVFQGLNLYLGNYLGEGLGELCWGGFFLISSRALTSSGDLPRWLGWVGQAFALLFLIGALRNITPAVQAIADLNNSLLPLWLIVLGLTLLRHARCMTFDLR